MAFVLAPLSRRCWRRFVGCHSAFLRERCFHAGQRAAVMSTTDAGDAKRARRDEVSPLTAGAATASAPGAAGGGNARRCEVDYVAATPESLRAALGEPILPNPLQLRVDGQDGRARACTISLPHGEVRTPVFMPVGTKGTIKCLTSEQVETAPLDCEIILGNTYGSLFFASRSMVLQQSSHRQPTLRVATLRETSPVRREASVARGEI